MVSSSPSDTFNLIRNIYDIPKETFEERLAYLSEFFDIKNLMNNPVRKLSLGQRMRVEFMAFLLHNPEVLFLDEPTIGMDIVVKQNVRNLIKQINQKEGKTIFLTSHDIGDIEKLCKRVIIINYGKIVFDGKLATLIKNYVHSKYIQVKLASPLKALKYDGATIIEQPSKYIGEIIVSGNLDYYLLYPKPILLHLAISKFDYTALGELLFSLVLLPFIHLTLFKLGLILLFSITGVIILSAVIILLNSSVFFFGSTGNFKSLLDSLYTFVVYPSNVYKGLVKFIILFIVPVGFVTGVPVDLIKNFDPLFFTLTLIISLSFLTLSIIVFYVGLRRYESGNLLTVRV